ncbi:hypothetical protein H2199_004186 [Coniosporium tulheliwenetii]|uniref:Uncharacterized protein n=1 Tax=Coniosporium tulheliwenetii TaxID=3383036 RepID=A0ACC2Z884_9PEZI|nr:hypothetical protein H2199_004186 [Cladosporium sp. JES 115]
MAIPRSKMSHEERTASEPRDSGFHRVILSHIEPVNESIRLLRLSVFDRQRGVKQISTVKFLPGQWLDVHIPGLPKAGGFTVTSTPAEAAPLPSAAQFSDGAVWLWRPAEEILGARLVVRVGGSFVWPPPGIDIRSINKVVFVAGGVGINPLISILAHLRQTDEMPREVHFLYTTKPPPAAGSKLKANEILFLDRLMAFTASPSAAESRIHLQLYLTGSSGSVPAKLDAPSFPGMIHHRRIERADLAAAVGPPSEAERTVVYVCGPARMTDEFVEFLRGVEGMDERRVLYGVEVVQADTITASVQGVFIAMLVIESVMLVELSIMPIVDELVMSISMEDEVVDDMSIIEDDVDVSITEDDVGMAIELDVSLLELVAVMVEDIISELDASVLLAVSLLVEEVIGMLLDSVEDVTSMLLDSVELVIMSLDVELVIISLDDVLLGILLEGVDDGIDMSLEDDEVDSMELVGDGVDSLVGAVSVVVMVAVSVGSSISVVRTMVEGGAVLTTVETCVTVTGCPAEIETEVYVTSRVSTAVDTMVLRTLRPISSEQRAETAGNLP